MGRSGQGKAKSVTKRITAVRDQRWWEGGEVTSVILFALERLEEGVVWIACHRLSFSIRHGEFFEK